MRFKITAILSTAFAIILSVILILFHVASSMPLCLKVVTGTYFYNKRDILRTQLIDPLSGAILTSEQPIQPQLDDPMLIFSPDGTRAAYLDDTTLKMSRFNMPPVAFYTPHLRDAYSQAIYYAISWSPDSEWVAYHWTQDNKDFLGMADRDGKQYGLTSFAHGNFQFGGWSADSKYLVTLDKGSRAEFTKIHMYSAPDLRVVSLGNYDQGCGYINEYDADIFYCDFWPGRGHLAAYITYDSGAKIVVLMPDDGSQRVFPVLGGYLTVSPDGNRVAQAPPPPFDLGDQELYIYDADGTIHNVGAIAYNQQKFWLPDGKGLLYIRTKQPLGIEGQPAQGQLMLYHLDTGQNEALSSGLETTSYHFQPSPSGHSVVLLPGGYTAGKPTHMFIVRIDSNQIYQIDTADAGFGQVAWSPDETMLKYVTYTHNATQFTSTVHVIGKDGLEVWRGTVGTQIIASTWACTRGSWNGN